MNWIVVSETYSRMNQAVEKGMYFRDQDLKQALVESTTNGRFLVILGRFKTKKDAEEFISKYPKLEKELFVIKK